LEIVARKYGEVDAKEFVPGAEILLETENVESVDNSDASDDEWVNISHSEDDSNDDIDDEDVEVDDSIQDEKVNDNSIQDEEGEEYDGNTEDVNKTDQSTCAQGLLKTDQTIPKIKVVTKREQLAEKKEKAAQVSSMRILTDEDFKRIEIAQLSKQMTTAKNRKRPAEPDNISRQRYF